MITFLQPFRVALLAEILRVRALSLIVSCFGIAQLVAGSFHLGFPCAFHETTGLPCPACGLTRSCIALFQGHPEDALLLHPFGPLLAAAIVLCLVSGFLPSTLRQRLARTVEHVEIKAALFPFLFMVLMLLWALRITHVLPLEAI